MSATADKKQTPAELAQYCTRVAERASKAATDDAG